MVTRISRLDAVRLAAPQGEIDDIKDEEDKPA
jgi:hypothetical protein